MGQAVGELAVVGQQDQAGALLVEPADRVDPLREPGDQVHHPRPAVGVVVGRDVPFGLEDGHINGSLLFDPFAVQGDRRLSRVDPGRQVSDDPAVDGDSPPGGSAPPRLVGSRGRLLPGPCSDDRAHRGRRAALRASGRHRGEAGGRPGVSGAGRRNVAEVGARPGSGDGTTACRGAGGPELPRRGGGPPPRRGGCCAMRRSILRRRSRFGGRVGGPPGHCGTERRRAGIPLIRLSRGTSIRRRPGRIPGFEIGTSRLNPPRPPAITSKGARPSPRRPIADPGRLGPSDGTLAPHRLKESPPMSTAPSLSPALLGVALALLPLCRNGPGRCPEGRRSGPRVHPGRIRRRDLRPLRLQRGEGRRPRLVPEGVHRRLHQGMHRLRRAVRRLQRSRGRLLHRQHRHGRGQLRLRQIRRRRLPDPQRPDRRRRQVLRRDDARSPPWPSA